ncbi:MFS transporter [Actinotalea sp. M2MS4P-6]|uniref:MFS transporter n=1 Tax=Actinotalea sp. M2MS4P-6 TaxID=2983762 RepID=UPI0021E443F6|nr:MFS transporter [Actinotalea sp. M2MS4P-6]MCV2393277.1 MFS transporter [Actinotalea sp. M2MS4P-6]
MSKAADAVRETRTSLATVFRNPNLRRINLAFAGSAIGDWAYATAIVIWAYDVGGVRAVGIWFTVRLILMTIATPFASTLVDRLPRRTVMVTTDLARGAIAATVAVLIWVDAAPISVFVLATLASIMSAPFRPAVAAILPTLVDSPDELTAANGTTSTIDSLSFLVGPALGGVLVTAIGVPFVVVFNAVTFLWSAALLIRIRVTDAEAEVAAVRADEAAVVEAAEELVAVAADERVPAAVDVAPAGTGGGESEPETDTGTAADGSAEKESSGFFAESMAGFRTIWANRDLRLVSGVYSAQTIVAGASAVFMIEMAVQMTPFGSRGVGYLDSVMGVGAVIGGLVAISRASAQRRATDFGVGVVFWALPLVLTAVWPQLWAAFLAMFVIGVANPVVDVNAATILQRTAPDEVMGRVFGALETALIGAMALGSAIMPLLIHAIGLRWSLAVLAAGISLAVLPAFGHLRRMNAELGEPDGLVLLRAIPMFAPVEPKALERMAQSMVRLEVPAGEVVIREGDEGDRFYVIESGALTATFHGEALSHMGAGDPFGEIALLRDVPRTATVTADEPSVLYALEREPFLDAVTGNSEVNSRADDLIGKRIPTY